MAGLGGCHSEGLGDSQLGEGLGLGTLQLCDESDPMSDDDDDEKDDEVDEEKDDEAREAEGGLWTW
jgi:hypothetical protein